MPLEPFVDADTAAAFLCIERAFLLKLARTAKIPAHPLGFGSRRVWLFRLSELETFMLSSAPAIPTQKGTK